jgi:hypothetical protein
MLRDYLIAGLFICLGIFVIVRRKASTKRSRQFAVMGSKYLDWYYRALFVIVGLTFIGFGLLVIGGVIHLGH